MTEPPASPAFIHEEHPDHPGWALWGFRDPTRFHAFLGELMVRVEDGRARVRMLPERRHSNLRDVIHGGTLLGFIDVALFAAARSLGAIVSGPAVTLDLNAHFVGAGRLGEPLEARVEVVKATGRMIFLRGLLVQGEDEVVTEFSGTIRKPAAR